MPFQIDFFYQDRKRGLGSSNLCSGSLFLLLYTLGNLIASGKSKKIPTTMSKATEIFFKWIKLTIAKKCTPSRIHIICIAKKGQEKISMKFKNYPQPTQNRIHTDFFSKRFIWIIEAESYVCEFFIKENELSLPFLSILKQKNK